MLTSADVASMRATAEDALPGTCVIHAGTLASDGGGGYTETFSALGTVVCRLAPAVSRGGGEAERGDRISAEADWVLTIPAGTTVETDDRVTTGGGTYNVVAIRDRDDWEITRRLEVTKIE